MKLPWTSAPPLALAALLVLAPCPVTAQTDSVPAPATRSLRDSAYTAAQATRGEATFREVCAQCHATSQFTGPTFLRSWTGRAAFDFFDLIRRSMPFDNPGALPGGRSAYADVLAYVFRLNGFPAGDRELPSDDASLKRVRIESPPGGP